MSLEAACTEKALPRQYRAWDAPDVASSDSLENAEMYDWFPIVFIVFKVVVLGTGMFFAIKWHHDQAKKDAQEKMDEQAQRAAEDNSRHDAGEP